MDSASQYALAYVLTATAGLRAFLTLAVASIAVHLGYIHPSAQFGWLGGGHVMWILIGAAAVEFVADKVPLLDHVVHGVQFAAKPAAAAILVGGTLPHGDSQTAVYGMMALGALNALGIHSASAGARAASTALSLGTGNPILSIIEDVMAIGGIILAFIAPVVAAVLALVLTVIVLRLAKQAWDRQRQRA